MRAAEKRSISAGRVQTGGEIIAIDGEIKMEQKALALALFATAMLAFAASVDAQDDAIQINQALVNAKGGLPFQINGFPYQINKSGTYRLVSNLRVPAGKNGIDVISDGVTIDLNGFSIIGPGNTGVNSDDGIQAGPRTHTTVENGTVTGFDGSAAAGVVAGKNSVIRNVHADSNNIGVLVFDNSVIQGCTANSNSFYGIECNGLGCAISGSTANSNGSDGIVCMGACTVSGDTANSNHGSGVWFNGPSGRVSGTTAHSNDNSGVSCLSGCTASDNTISDNGSDDVQ
jgi:hypothetical protein